VVLLIGDPVCSMPRQHINNKLEQQIIRNRFCPDCARYWVAATRELVALT